MYQNYADAEGLITKESLKKAFDRIAIPKTEEEIADIFESYETEKINFDQFKSVFFEDLDVDEIFDASN